MKKSSYFKFVGYAELVCSAILIVYKFIELCNSHPNNAGDAWLKVFIFLVIAFFAPAVGVLFLTYGKDYEKRENEKKTNEPTEKPSNQIDETTETSKEATSESTKDE